MPQALDALFVRLGEPRVERGVLEQQHQQHEARGQQPVDPPDIETEIETAGVEHCGERDVEDPRAHHDHEPQVEHRMRAPPPQEKRAREAQSPDAGNDTDHRRRIAVALHDRRQMRLAGRGEGSPSRPRARSAAAIARQDRGARVPLRRRRRVDASGRGARRRSREAGTARARTCTARRCSAVRRRAGRSARTGPGKVRRVRNGDERGEEVAAGEHQQPARSQDAELTEQQDRGDQVVDDQRGLIDRDERADRRKRHLGEGHRRQKDRRGDRHTAPRASDRGVGLAASTGRTRARPSGRAPSLSLDRPPLSPAGRRLRAARAWRPRASGARSRSPELRRSRGS